MNETCLILIFIAAFVGMIFGFITGFVIGSDVQDGPEEDPDPEEIELEPKVPEVCTDPNVWMEDITDPEG